MSPLNRACQLDLRAEDYRSPNQILPLLESCSLPDTKFQELEALDRLWLDFELPPVVTTDAFPLGDIDFFSADFRNESAAVNPRLLMGNDISTLSQSLHD